MKKSNYHAINHSSFCVDMLYPVEQQTAAYIIIDNGVATVIDCGAKYGDQLLLSALFSLNLQPKDVRWLIITHAHLDHAGAAGHFMQVLPNAILCGHPTTIKHLVSPAEKLIPAASTLYGMGFYKKHYGELLPVDITRTRCLDDGEKIELSPSRYLKTIYTYGHAWHHLSIVDTHESLIFAGDAYGISYSSLGINSQQLIVPVMPPSQFNPEAMANSINLIHHSGAQTAALSHFNHIPISEQSTSMLLNTLERWLLIAKNLWHNNGNGRDSTFMAQLNNALINDIKNTANHINIDSTAAIKKHSGDLLLSAKGIEYYLQRQQEKN